MQRNVLDFKVSNNISFDIITFIIEIDVRFADV